MRRIVHLSDLHFGRIDPETLDPLREDLRGSAPDLLVVSGDLTQRARRREFRAAREFLASFDFPRVVVPGNHDVPLYDLRERFLDPLGRWREHFSPETEPEYVDEEIAVVGVNTARSLALKNGRVNRAQVERLRERFRTRDEGVLKAIVSHHPFDLPPGGDEKDLVGRARMAMEAFAACGADLFLSGHLHHPSVGGTTERWRIAGRSALVVHAGTATSSRLRGTANSYNRIAFASPRMTIERRVFEPESLRFVSFLIETFERGTGGWQRTTAT